MLRKSLNREFQFIRAELLNRVVETALIEFVMVLRHTIHDDKGSMVIRDFPIFTT